MTPSSPTRIMAASATLAGLLTLIAGARPTAGDALNQDTQAPAQGASTSPAAGQDQATAEDAAAREVLDATIARYHELKSYRDKFKYEARMVAKAGEEPELGFLEGALLFTAPNRLVSKSEALHVYYDGEHLTRYMPSTRQYTTSDGPAALRMLTPGGMTMDESGGLGVHPLAALLLDHDLSAEQALAIATLTDVHPETRDGRKGQLLSGKLRLPAVPGSGLLPFTAFINDQTKLFEQVSVDVTDVVRAGAQQAPEASEMANVDRAEIVLTFDDVKVDGDIPDDAFTFDVAGAQKVEMFGFTPERPVSPLELLGQPAPTLSGPTLDGKAFDLAAERGKVVVIAFWGAWAPDTARLWTDLKQLATKHMDRPLTVIGVNRNSAAGETVVKDLLTRAEAQFPQVLDRDGGIDESWRVASLPTIFLIDAEGQIADAHPYWNQTTNETVGEQVTKLLASKPLYTADELAARRARSGDVDLCDGLMLKASDEEYQAQRLEVSQTNAVMGSRWNSTEQDIDGDGQPELIMPDWQGGLSIVDPYTEDVRRVRLRNLQQISMQSVRGVPIDGEMCWLCAGSKYGMSAGAASRQQALVRLYSPDGEVLWTFRPAVSEETNSNACAAAGDLDGDGRVEYAIGLTTFTPRSTGENSYTWENMKGRLIILDDDGRLIAQRDVTQQIDMLYVPSGRPGKPTPVLCFAGGQLERYMLKTNGVE